MSGGEGKEGAVAKAAGALVLAGIAASIAKSLFWRNDQKMVRLNDFSHSKKKKWSFDSCKSYEVQDGDSLWSISREFSVTVDEIKSVNGLLDDTIYTGEKLSVPM